MFSKGQKFKKVFSYFSLLLLALLTVGGGLLSTIPVSAFMLDVSQTTAQSDPVVLTIGDSGGTFTTQSEKARNNRHNKKHHNRPVKCDIVGGCVPVWGPDVDFIVSIQVKGGAGKDARDRHLCGGSLISPTTVESAAHCFYKSGRSKDPQYVKILAGTNRLGHIKRHSYRVLKVTVHPDFKQGPASHDVARIDLANPVDPSVAQPITLATEEDADLYLPGSEVTACGWGDTRQHRVKQKRYRFDPSPVLKCATLNIVTDEECDEANGSPLDMEQSFCAGDHGEDTCQGDSGGPVYARRADGTKVLLGSTSGGSGCASPGRPGYYADVRPNRDFLLPVA